jgi:hypothetical protein
LFRWHETAKRTLEVYQRAADNKQAAHILETQEHRLP